MRTCSKYFMNLSNPLLTLITSAFTVSTLNMLSERAQRSSGIVWKPLLSLQRRELTISKELSLQVILLPWPRRIFSWVSHPTVKIFALTTSSECSRASFSSAPSSTPLSWSFRERWMRNFYRSRDFPQVWMGSRQETEETALVAITVKPRSR